jgi:hypothetical protein
MCAQAQQGQRAPVEPSALGPWAMPDVKGWAGQSAPPAGGTSASGAGTVLVPPELDDEETLPA